MHADELTERFRDKFHMPPRVFIAPGRVNLIGEYSTIAFLLLPCARILDQGGGRAADRPEAGFAIRGILGAVRI
jgi:hypothetical protein